jgi:hypothetical protein
VAEVRNEALKIVQLPCSKLNLSSISVDKDQRIISPVGISIKLLRIGEELRGVVAAGRVLG